jgi:AcrR family transcriptional regulator
LPTQNDRSTEGVIEDKMPAKKLDRRIIRSKSLLFNALIKLMRKKDYQDISVKDLADAADISRPTFYRIYKSIDDILIEEMDLHFDEYFVSIEKDIIIGNYKNAADKLFKVWRKNKTLFDAMQKAGIIYKAADRFDEYALRIKRLTAKDGELAIDSTYAIHFFAGGTYMVLKKWQQSDMKTPVNDLVDLLATNFEFLSLA